MSTSHPQLSSVSTRRCAFSTSLTVGLWGATAALFAACTQLGPRSIPADRFDYSTAVADSWKQQALLNIVKVRYMDLPVFVDVASIVAGYSMETSASVGAQLFPGDAILDNNTTLGATGKFTDRPTITYVPLTGEKFLRGLITPIDPKHIFSMLQSGYAADFILALTVESINGVRNRSTAGGTVRDADPEFMRVLELLREVQAAGAFGMRVEEDAAKSSMAVVFFRRDDVPAEILEKSDEIRRLLNLSTESQKFTIIYSPMRGATHELTVNSRSMLQVMGAYASYIDVPQAHVQDGSATPTLQDADAGERRSKVRIRSGKDKPASAFAAVRYRDHWFWIDESDWQTKRALTAVMFFFTIAETGGNERLPLITIPAQ